MLGTVWRDLLRTLCWKYPKIHRSTQRRKPYCVSMQGRCDILAQHGPSTATDRFTCLCMWSAALRVMWAHLWRSCLPLLGRGCVASRGGCRLLQCKQQFWRGSHLHSKTQIYAARTQLLLRPLPFGSSALPSASAIEVCARSAAEVSFLQACSACPEGGQCAGKLSPPIAAKDWWGIDGDTLFTSCPTDVQNGRCLGSTNCGQVSTHASIGQDGQLGGTAWLDGLEGWFALGCTVSSVVWCSYTRAVFASGATMGTTLGSGSASSAPTTSHGPRKTR